MKKIVLSTLVTLSLTTCTLIADDLVKKATAANLKPIPSKVEVLNKLIDPKGEFTPAKLELGKKLYFDPRLSKSNLISCNTCHNLALGGADTVPAAIGHKWTVNPHHLNSPTVYNAVFNKAQFWDGRSPHLADQAQGPIQAGPEMAAPKELVEQRINSIPAYVAEFQAAYGKDVKVTFEKIADTIALYEQTLVTPSRYDEFLEGKADALTSEEQDGLKLFIDKGCVSCHNDIALGGSMQPFQVVNKYKFANIGDFKGDANGMVRTPTLRNIAETAPYFHNGQIWTLEEAVKEMGSVQLGVDINDKEATSIATFLHTLTGKKPEVIYPILPASTKETPKPDAM